MQSVGPGSFSNICLKSGLQHMQFDLKVSDNQAVF